MEWRELARDPIVLADLSLVRRFRKVPLETLCRVDLDLEKLGLHVRQAPNESRLKKAK